MIPNAVFIATGVVYVIALIGITSMTMMMSLSGDGVLANRLMKRMVSGLVLLALIVRTVWMFARTGPAPTLFTSHRFLFAFLNRLSLLVFFTAFTIVVARWGITVRQIQRKSSKAYLIGIIVGCSILWLFQLVFLGVTGALDWPEKSYHHDEFWYKMDSVAISLCFLFPALAFVRYLRQFNLLMGDRVNLPSDRSRNAKSNMRRFSFIVVVCFTLRFVAFLYGAIYGGSAKTQSFDAIIYPTFFYTIPDIVPAFAILILAADTPHHDEMVSCYEPLTAETGFSAWDDSIAEQRAVEHVMSIPDCM